MEFKVRIRDAFTPKGRKLAILPIEGRFDSKAASSVRQLVQQVLGFGYTNVLLNLEAVTFMDSSGLGVLVSSMRKCREAGGTLCLCCVPESVSMVLTLTSMNKVFTCFEDEEIGVGLFPDR